MHLRIRACLLVLASTVATAADLSLPTSTVAPGSAVLLPLSLAAQSRSVAGVQFDLQFDSTAFSLTATLGDTARAAGKSITLWQLYPGLWRFFIFGLNQAQLSGGPLLNILATVSAGASSGAYGFQILNVVASDPSAQPLTLTATDGSIVVDGDPASALHLQSWGVLNAASMVAGSVAPGEIVTLLGSSIGSGSVSFDDVPAPILYAGSGQVNLVVPYAVQSQTSTQLKIKQDGAVIAQLQVPVAAAAPAIFTVDGSGAGPGAILNQDYSLNTSTTPATKGSAIMIFATGAGQTNPPGVDDQIAGNTLPQPVLPVSVQIGGVLAQVLYAGAAPGLISGILQVNCIVPTAAPSGWGIPVVLTVGTISSPTGVTLAIQ